MSQRTVVERKNAVVVSFVVVVVAAGKPILVLEH